MMGDMVELVTVKREDLEDIAREAVIAEPPVDKESWQIDDEVQRTVNNMIMENLGGWVQISE